MIFDLSLSDDYIFSLSWGDSEQLILEAGEYVYDLEDQILDLVGDLMNEDSVFSPSEVSWDPQLYLDEVESRPWMKDRLLAAESIRADIGRAEAIQHTARLNKMRIEAELDEQ